MEQTILCELHYCDSVESISYEVGHLYFFKDTHLLGICTAQDSITYFSGVQSVTETNAVIKIINESGNEITLDLSDVASASVLQNLKDAVGTATDLNTDAKVLVDAINELSGKQGIPYDSITDSTTYNVINKSISVKDAENSNAEILLNGQQVLVMDHAGGVVRKVSSVQTDTIAMMSAASGDIFDSENLPVQYNIISMQSGSVNDMPSITVESAFNGGASDIKTVLDSMSITFYKQVGTDSSNTVNNSIKIGYDNDNFTSDDAAIIISNTTAGTTNYYALRNDTTASNSKDNVAYIATENYVDSVVGDINTILEAVLNNK